MSHRARLALAIIAASGLLLQLRIGFRDLDVVDRLFIPDDTYYTLAVARSMAHGTGPSVDGEHLTNGFQPLLAFLLVPVFALTSDLDAPLRAALLLGIICNVVCALLLARLAFRIRGDAAAIFAGLVWTFSPVATANALVGLETSLAVMMGIALTELWCQARIGNLTRSYILAGALAGLALLSRVDTIFLVAPLGLFEFIRGHRKGALVATAVAFAVVAPWWMYSAAHFGSPIPESGAAVREQISLQQPPIGMERQIAWAVGSIVGPPFLDATGLRRWLFGHARQSLILCPVLLILFVTAVIATTRRNPARLPLSIFFGYGAMVCCFYVSYLPALWFFRRYLAPVHSVTALLMSVIAAILWRLRRQNPTAILGLIALGFCFAIGCYTALSYT